MLVSGIGYFDANSNNLYGVENNNNKSQSRSSASPNEFFGNYKEALPAKPQDNLLKKISKTVKSFMMPKPDTTKCKKHIDVVS